MLKSYEARYDRGQLTWIDDDPDLADGEELIVVVGKRAMCESRKQDIHLALDQTRGAWGGGMSLEEIDELIRRRRDAEWPESGESAP